MKQTDVDLILARAQVAMAFLFAILLFTILAALLYLLATNAPLNSAILTIIGSVIASLITVLTLQQNFFYARQRPSALPDPNSPPGSGTLTVSTTTTPTTGDANVLPSTQTSTTATTTTTRPAPPSAPGVAGAST